MTEPTRLRSIDLRDALEYHSGVFDDVDTKQLEGWGASNFLVHAKWEQPSRGHGFRIVAEWRSGSGSMYDRNYATLALQTWHLLAQEVLALREALEQKGDCDRDDLLDLLKAYVDESNGVAHVNDEGRRRTRTLLSGRAKRSEETPEGKDEEV